MNVVVNVLICFENLLNETCCEEIETNNFALISGFYEILSFDVAVQIFIYLLFFLSLSHVPDVCSRHMAT